MGKFAEKYKTWDENHRNLFILIVVAITGALICVPFIFLENIGVLFGWLLGSVVNIFAYVSIYKGASYILNNSSNARQGYLDIAWGILRFALYAGVLLLSGFASFKWGTLSHGYCNLISASLALMPTWITLVVALLLRNAKATKKNEEKPEEEAHD